MPLPEEPRFGLFWRRKHVIFEVADSIFQRERKLLRHLMLDPNCFGIKKVFEASEHLHPFQHQW